MSEKNASEADPSPSAVTISISTLWSRRKAKEGRVKKRRNRNDTALYEIKDSTLAQEYNILLRRGSARASLAIVRVDVCQKHCAASEHALLACNRTQHLFNILIIREQEGGGEGQEGEGGR